MKRIENKKGLVLLLAAAVALPVIAASDDVVMFGSGPSRNMISHETGLPGEWDAVSGKNVLWTAELGSQTYAGPVVKDGRVYVGTNNEAKKNSKLTGDRGNIMVFDEKTGELLWQSAHAKLPSGRVNDWPLQGICSTPAIEGNRVYYMSNRGEMIAADVEGFRDGENDGPYKDEEHKSEIDEDIIWRYDMIAELDVFPHNLAAGSPLLVGDMLYAITGQGVDEGHINLPSPFGPSFVAFNKNTGELVWESSLPGENVLHGSWSNPSYAEIGGVAQVIFPGGDGILYSFEPLKGELLWTFDLNPAGTKWELGGRGTKNNVISMPVVHDGIIFIAVGQDPEHGEGPGNLWALNVAGKKGDLTKQEGVVKWHLGGEEFHRTMSSAAIADGLMYIADLNGFLYCLDVETGKKYWTYDTFAAIWGSAWIADGKVYLGDEDGDIAVLKHGKKMELLHESNMGAAVYTTPVAHDGTIFVASRKKLFAIKTGAGPKKKATPQKPEKGKPAVKKTETEG